MRHCIIVVGGHINDIFAKEFIEKERPELCIAAEFRDELFLSE